MNMTAEQMMHSRRGTLGVFAVALVIAGAALACVPGCVEVARATSVDEAQICAQSPQVATGGSAADVRFAEFEIDGWLAPADCRQMWTAHATAASAFAVAERPLFLTSHRLLI